MREKGTNVKDIELVTDTPFEPTIIYKMLNNIRSEIFHVEGRQEDAEEFLGCILNKLNDEMLEVSFNYLNLYDPYYLGCTPTNAYITSKSVEDQIRCLYISH